MMNINNLPKETYISIYSGLLRTYDERVYFDVLKYTIDGYFVSWLGDQRLEDSKLMNSIMNGDKKDWVNESQHILIEQVTYKMFIKEFIIQSEKNKIFISTAKKFMSSINLNDLFGEYGVQEFIEFIEINHPNADKEFVSIFGSIYGKTQKGLAINWLKTISTN